MRESRSSQTSISKFYSMCPTPYVVTACALAHYSPTSVHFRSLSISASSITTRLAQRHHEHYRHHWSIYRPACHFTHTSERREWKRRLHGGSTARGQRWRASRGRPDEASREVACRAACCIMGHGQSDCADGRGEDGTCSSNEELKPHHVTGAVLSWMLVGSLEEPECYL